MSPYIDVIYAGNLEPGDLYAGHVNPDAPTRPVQPCARAMRLTEVTTYRDDGRLMVRPVAKHGPLTPMSVGSQVMVIRGVES